jgi:hypothetical protein
VHDRAEQVGRVAAAIATKAPSGGSRRMRRIDATAWGSANCSPETPPMKRPPRISPRAWSRRQTRTRSRQGGSQPASSASIRQQSTPYRRSSTCTTC